MSVKSNPQTTSEEKTSLAALPLIGLIRTYQLVISPLLGQNCRFFPSCSCYAHQALKTHGLIKGTALAAKRISKCHPLHPGGIDHVPEANQKDKHITK